MSFLHPMYMWEINRLGYREDEGVKEGCSRDETEGRGHTEKVGQRLTLSSY